MKPSRLLKKIVDEWDPVSLFPFAPEDEYESEIGQIVALLDAPISMHTLADSIEHIFSESFEMEFETNECRLIAQAILKEKK